MDTSKYNCKCPLCGCDAYEGLRVIECSNTACTNWPKHKDKPKPTVTYNDSGYFDSEGIWHDEKSNPKNNQDSYCDPCCYDDDPDCVFFKVKTDSGLIHEGDKVYNSQGQVIGVVESRIHDSVEIAPITIDIEGEEFSKSVKRIYTDMCKSLMIEEKKLSIPVFNNYNLLVNSLIEDNAFLTKWLKGE